MHITHRFIFICLGLLFCSSGCDSVEDEDNVLLPDGTSSENVQFASAQIGDSTNIEVSFEQNLLPILTARCAFAGCHVAGGPEGIDLSTYQSFIRGGDDVFTPGNSQSSDIIEEMVSGRMPPGGPRVPDAEIHLFIDWINQQEPRNNNQRDNDDHHDDDDDDEHDDDDDDDEHDDDDDDD